MKKLLLIICTLFCTINICFANEGIGMVAANIADALFSISSLMLAVCMITGFSFIITAAIKFHQHRRNPQQMPLGNSISMLILGICLLALPYGLSFTESAFNSENFVKSDKQQSKAHSIYENMTSLSNISKAG